MRRLPLLLLCLLLAAPVLTVLGSWLQWDGQTALILGEMAQTVLPDYAGTSLAVCALVAVLVISMGTVSALAVTLFDFPGRRLLEWALLLPLAMPAYVVAYAYTDFFQFSGPLQSALRSAFGWHGALWPDVRSWWGAAIVLAVCLYPYVYLLVRTALSERATTLMEAARTLGASLPRRITQVALPLARPAIAAGTALALMETLADFGVASYFGVQTFTAGIYKAWLVMDNRVAAAQLSTALLGLVVLMLALEHHAQSRLRFAANRAGPSRGQEAQALRLRGPAAALATLLCGMPVFLGFVLPLGILIHALWVSLAAGASGEALPAMIDWTRFGGWAFNSLRLGALTAVLAICVALPLAASMRRGAGGWATRGAARLAGLGYAVPGVVIVVGLLLPLGWLQAHWPEAGWGVLLTGSALGLVWAYLVRFVAVALQSLQSGYARIPSSLDESARILGVSGWRLLWRVHAPLLRRSTLVAGLLVLVDVMKELPATLVLRPFNTDTLAVMAYQLARDERLGEAALPSLALVLVGLIPVVMLSRTLRR